MLLFTNYCYVSSGNRPARAPSLCLAAFICCFAALNPLPAAAAPAQASTTAKVEPAKKAAPATSTPVINSAKTTVPAKSDSKAKTEVKTEVKNSSKSDGKAAVSKTATVKSTTKKKTSSAVVLVPPPPPTIPSATSLLLDPSALGYMSYGMPVELMSKESLKEKEKEISIQYKDALSEFTAKKQKLTDKEERAKNFEGLFAEGVVSRRELETAQQEAQEFSHDVSRLSTKETELKSLLERVTKRLAQFNKVEKPANKSKPKKLNPNQRN